MSNNSKYRLIYETPEGRCHVEANNADALRSIVSDQVWQMIRPQESMAGLSLDEAAKEALRIYMASRERLGQRRSHSTIISTGSGVDVCRCYLQNMTITQTMDHINNTKEVQLSHSAVGRFCTALRKLGISSERLGCDVEEVSNGR